MSEQLRIEIGSVFVLKKLINEFGSVLIGYRFVVTNIENDKVTLGLLVSESERVDILWKIFTTSNYTQLVLGGPPAINVERTFSYDVVKSYVKEDRLVYISDMPSARYEKENKS